MKPLYYREINFASDKFNRQGGDRSRPVFYLNDSPIVGCRYLGLKNVTIPISWLNLPEDETLRVQYEYFDINEIYKVDVTVPAGQYDVESMGAMLTNLFAASAGYDTDNDDPDLGGLYLPVRNFILEQVTSGKDINKLLYKFTPSVALLPGAYRWRFDFANAPVTARLLGWPSGERYTPWTPHEIQLLGPPSRFLEPQSLWIRSSLGNGILHFGQSFSGKSNSQCGDVIAKIVFNPSETIFNGIVAYETNPTPSSENLFSFSCYTAISQFDMWLSTHPTSLYPNGRQIDLQGQVWSGTLCMLCEVPS
jgi:hypothetical protein